MSFVIYAYNIFTAELPECNFVLPYAHMVSYALIRKLVMTDTFHSPFPFLPHLRVCRLAIHNQQHSICVNARNKFRKFFCFQSQSFPQKKRWRHFIAFGSLYIAVLCKRFTSRFM